VILEKKIDRLGMKHHTKQHSAKEQSLICGSQLSEVKKVGSTRK